jgi:hypothetical protein
MSLPSHGHWPASGQRIVLFDVNGRVLEMTDEIAPVGFPA